MGVKVRERPKGSGIWWIFIDHQGKRKAKRIGTDKRLAFEIAKKLEAKLVLKELNLKPKNRDQSLIFKNYATKWLEEYIKNSRRISTYERYRDALIKHVFPTLGNRSILDLSRGEVRGLLLKLYSNGLSRSFLGIVHATISGPLAYALDEELITVNPVIG